MTENWDEPKRRGWLRPVLFAALGLVVAVGAVLGGVYLFGNDPATETSPQDSADPTAPEPTDDGDESDDEVSVGENPNREVLPHPMSGQEAIDELGEDIDFVAQRNNMTVEELEDLLLNSDSAHVSTNGFIFYRDPAPSD